MPQIKEMPLHTIPVVEPEAALDDVIEQMRSEPLHAVALVNEGQYLGLFTEEDVDDSSLIPPGADLSLLAVGPYVHPIRVVADPSESAESLLALLVRHGMNAAPVVQNRTFLGIVTRRDLEAAVR